MSSGGEIQLVSESPHNLFLTKNPQITFFKAIYRRHTNFAIESIRQNFLHAVGFNKKATCYITMAGDLVSDIFLVVSLPKIDKFCDNEYTKFAWVKKIGFALVKMYEIEIGGFLIDRQYGDWLNIWSELTENKYYGYRKMIGDIDELCKYSYEKEEYTLYIPLTFWFCRNVGMSLPITCLQYSDVKIHFEFNSFEYCSLISPTSYIEIEDDIVLFEEGDEIKQKINNQIIYGEFIYHDIINKRLYYNKKSEKSFVNSCGCHFICGKYSCVNAISNTIELDYQFGVDFKDAYLLIDYIYVDKDERERFLNSTHSYLITQLYYSGEKVIQNPAISIKIDFFHPSKLLVWITQTNTSIILNDHFNYTDRGEKIIKAETILINDVKRLSIRDSNYFQLLQVYQFFSQSSSPGINLYSFSLYPEKPWPSGACNLSQFDFVDIDLRLYDKISKENNVKFKAYSLNYNVLKIKYGLGGLIFSTY